MADVEISVVVPVYNAEAYLCETLESLAAQTFRDLEVILVDDGSTDGGARIMEDFCASHGRFRALHIPNGGEHNARLTGIRAARGRYIAFCDSDDLPLPDMLEKLYAAAERTNADVTVCGFTREEMERGRVLSREMTRFEPRGYTPPELWDVLPVVNVAVWNKLFRAELLSHVISFEKPPRVAEDLMWFCSLFPFLRCVAFVPEPRYRYRVRPGSTISRVSDADIEAARACMLLTRDAVLKQNDGGEMRALLDSVAFIHFGWAQVAHRTKGGGSSRKTVASARKWLEENFPGYRKAGKSLAWNLRHGFLQFRVLIGRWIFCAHLMGPGLAAYRFITQKCGKEIKW